MLLGRAGRPAEFCKHTPVERQGGPKSGASIAYYPSVPDCRVLSVSDSLLVCSWVQSMEGPDTTRIDGARICQKGAGSSPEQQELYPGEFSLGDSDEEDT